MPLISDFNSLWEVGFAINALFILFEYERHTTKQLKKLISLADKELKKNYNLSLGFISHNSHCITRSRYFALPIYYTLLCANVRLLAVINTILTLSLLFYSAFFSHTEISYMSSSFIVFFIFFPIIYSIYQIHIIIPYIILFELQNELCNLINTQSLSAEEIKIEKIKVENLILDVRVKDAPYSIAYVFFWDIVNYPVKKTFQIVRKIFSY